MKQGQRVRFNVHTLVGTGVIVGKSTTEQAVIGASYIIQPDNDITTDFYPYSHFTAFESQLTVLN
jgi:hypothetical protein